MVLEAYFVCRFQPAGREFLKSHLSVLGVAGL